MRAMPDPITKHQFRTMRHNASRSIPIRFLEARPSHQSLASLLAYGARLSNSGNVSKHVVSRLIVHLGLEGILILEGVCSGGRGPRIDQVEPTLKMRH
jgi:hypothetical protein